MLLDDYEVHPFEDPNRAPNKALFRLLLTYVDTHYKTIIQRKETYGFGDKSVLALQAQCASLTSVEQNNTQRDFTGMRPASWESLSLIYIGFRWQETRQRLQETSILMTL